MGRERRARESWIRVWWEMGDWRLLGRGASLSQEWWWWRGELAGRSEIAERMAGVVVRRTMVQGVVVALYCQCCVRWMLDALM